MKLTSEEIIAEIQGLKPLLPIVATIANPILPPTESGTCVVTNHQFFATSLLEMAIKRYDIGSSDALFLFLDAPRTIEEHLLVKSANTSTKDIVEEKRY